MLFLATTFPGPLPLASLRIFRLVAVVDEIQRFSVLLNADGVPDKKDGTRLAMGRKARAVHSVRGLYATTKRVIAATRGDGMVHRIFFV